MDPLDLVPPPAPAREPREVKPFSLVDNAAINAITRVGHPDHPSGLPRAKTLADYAAEMRSIDPHRPTAVDPGPETASGAPGQPPNPETALLDPAVAADAAALANL